MYSINEYTLILSLLIRKHGAQHSRERGATPLNSDPSKNTKPSELSTAGRERDATYPPTPQGTPSHQEQRRRQQPPPENQPLMQQHCSNEFLGELLSV
ncbi:protein transport protein SEC31-like isoform X2 [Thunnus maccoyii]|uniref:protein transport protein SEC31-like isoform X2 n=1 Tax=Thunnus maccoyii TaxID=8240 RepID=UPI001C4B19A5|nr:protein transport protein SEC31-like isoform X2 [Thunnus maccoyii]